MQNQKDSGARSAISNMAMRLKQHEAQLLQLTALQKATADAPKWIEQIPGRRVPFGGITDLPIPANSTAKQGGIFNVAEDGPFVMTGIGLFYKRTEGPFAGIWGYATAADSRLTTGYPDPGFAGMDRPHVTSGGLEIIDRGSDRLWQSKELPTSLFNAEAGGVYMLPIACLFDRASAVEQSFTPGLAVDYAGVVQCVLLGYKIVQGQSYQP